VSDSLPCWAYGTAVTDTSGVCDACGEDLTPPLLVIYNDEPTFTSGEHPAGLPRRDLVIGLSGLAAGLAIAGVTAVARWPGPRDPFGAQVNLGDAVELVSRITEAGAPVMITPKGADRPVAVTLWDLEHPGAVELYGTDQPISERGLSLMVLRPVSTEPGCRVSICQSSGWFEDPCHASRWNRWGELVDGPAPRGLDRYASTINAEGALIVHLSALVPGVPTGEGRSPDQPSGDNCIGP